MTQEYFSIALASDISLAISLDDIGKIIQLEIPNICSIPGVSDFWYGVINLKGSLLWILDSDLYFKVDSRKEKKELKKISSVVIKHHQQDSKKQVAIVTSKLEGIITVDSQQLEKPPEQASQNLKNCCSNFVSYQNKHTYILNSVNLLEQLYKQSALLSA